MPRVFVSEFVCGGGWPGDCPQGSLRREGAAMLSAIARDFAAVSGVTVTTTWDRRLGECPVSGVRVVVPGGIDDESRVFAELSAECDATLVIAPEFHGLLRARCERVLAVGGRLLGPSPEVIGLCGDKLALSERLRAAGVPTLPTALLPNRDAWEALPWPIVVKPREGAGSLNTFLVRNARELEQALSSLDPPELPPEIWQPFVPGRALSVGVLVHSDDAGGRRVSVFPVGEQRLTDDGRFQYLGGRLPAVEVPQPQVESLVRNISGILGSGLRGYIGLDLILPHATGAPLCVVEVNPRLTTGYLGYRELARGNLAEWWLNAGNGEQDLNWDSDPVEFAADGGIVQIGSIPG